MWVSFCVFFLIASTLETHGICTAWKSESYCALVTYLIRLDNGLHWCLGLPRKPISLSSDWHSAYIIFCSCSGAVHKLSTCFLLYHRKWKWIVDYFCGELTLASSQTPPSRNTLSFINRREGENRKTACRSK